MKPFQCICFIALFLACIPVSHAEEKNAADEKKTAEEQPASPFLPLPSIGEAVEKDPYLYKDIAFFLRALAIVRENYVDKDKVSDEKLLKAALRGMLQELDPFSMYETPEQLKAIREDTTGRFAGIGLTLSLRGNLVQVVSVVDGAPAQKAGILPDDVLTEIDGIPAAKMSFRSCVAKLKGPPGTQVKVRVYRRSSDKNLNFTLTRSLIKIPSLRGAKVIGDEFGYIRIMNFSATTAQDLDKVLADFAARKVKGIVIDLRNNPGGLLNAAVEVCSRFLKKGELVVYTEGQSERAKQRFYAVDAEKCLDLPLVLLVNGNTASAAEIFAGCLQDHNRAVLLGTKTFGKGSVQTVIPLADRGAMRLTTGKYYTPSRRVIHEKGITPDILVSMTPASEALLSMRLNSEPGEIHAKDRRGVKDIQLERALELLKGVDLFMKNRNGK